MMHLSANLFIALALVLPVLSTPATTEQFKQWILANRKNIYGDSNSIGDGDLARTILRLFGLERSTVSSTTMDTTTSSSTMEAATSPYTSPTGEVRSSSVRPPFNWNTITPTVTPKWNTYTTVKKTPWYIKDRSTWPSIYNRVRPQTTTMTTDEATTISEASTTTELTTDTSLTSTTSPLNPWARVWTTTTNAPSNPVAVSVLQSGSLRPLRDGQLEAVGAITLINDNGFYVLVDTGASSDTERLLHSLSKEGVSPEQIDAVVITHGHPGHMGNMNFFARKPILFHSMEFIGRHVTPTELRERPYRKLSMHIEIWKTPGHSQQDLTVLVHEVANYGTMAIVGDLIPSESYISEKRDILDEDSVWDSTIKRQNANLIICMADWIVPGHGQPFRVLPHYRFPAS